ncbi:MAG: ArsA family ATPase [Bacteroidota bacterium]
MTGKEQPTQSFLDQRCKLIFLGGKGGVGKSSLSAAIATYLSQQYKTLLISTDPAHSLQDSFEATQFKEPTKPFAAIKNLDVWELDSHQAFNDFKQKHHKELRLLFESSTYMDDDDIDELMTLMLPGIDEIMALKTITDIIKDEKYDKLVIDTAPTGHALRLLLMPDTLNAWVKVMAGLRWKYREIHKTFKGKYHPDDADDLLMDLKRLVSRMKSYLSGDGLCEFIIATTPVKMAYQEALRFKDLLLSANITTKHLIINKIAPDSQDPFYHQLFTKQATSIDRISALFENFNILKVPMLNEEIIGIKNIEMVAKHLFSKN